MAMIPLNDRQSVIRIDPMRISALFSALFLVLPLADVFHQTLVGGWQSALAALKDYDAFLILLALNALQMFFARR